MNEESETEYMHVVGVVEPYRKEGESTLPMNFVFFRTSPTRNDRGARSL